MSKSNLFHRRVQTGLLLDGLWTRLDAVKELALEIESTIQSRLQEIDESAGKLSEVEDEHYRDHLSEQISDRHYTISYEWTAVTRESLLLTLCSSFEHSLNRLADCFAVWSQSPFRIKDLNERGIKRCRMLFTKLGISASAFGAEWSRLESVYEVRNKIAHAGGTADEALLKKLGTLSSIFELSDNGSNFFEDPKDKSKRIVITPQGIGEVCDLVTEATRAINRAIIASQKK